MRGGMKNDFDILIIGGGLVGASLACALANRPINIGIIESHPLGTARGIDWSLGLSLPSVRILQALELWPALKTYATPIEQVHISNAGQFGTARFSAQDYHVNALGYVIPAQTLLRVVQEQSLASNVHWYCPAELQALEPSPQGYSVRVQVPPRHLEELATTGDMQLTTRLLVAADGSDSWVRRCLNIPVKIQDYSQVALIARADLARSHQQIAYERFNQNGSIAALPLSGNRSGIIWVLDAAQANRVAGLNALDFSQELQAALGGRLGRLLRVERQGTLPIKTVAAEQQIQNHLVLLGNAAHMLHPVAAQGFNLGLADMFCLAKTLIQATQQGTEIGAPAVLQAYLRKRRRKQKIAQGFTSGLVKVFSPQTFPLPHLRGLGLYGLDNAAWLKRALVRHILT